MHIPAGRPSIMVKRPQFRRTLIREWRNHRKLTLEQLGEKAEMTASHLSMLERGERGYTQETLEVLARALGTDPGSLLNRRPSEADFWPLWERAEPEQRDQLAEMARILIRRRD